jgi:hypothetical protein
MRGNNVARPGDSATPQDWFKDLPIVTKFLLTSTILSTLATYFSLTSPGNFALVWPLVWQKFQIWRLVGCITYAGKFEFAYLFHILMLYQNSLKYETDPYNTGAFGTSADYLWMIILCTLALYALSAVFGLYYLAEPFLFCILYVCSRRNAEGQTSFFGLKFKTLYVPWVNVAYRLLIGGGLMMPLLGIAVGHVYYFLVEILPTLHGMTLIKTPSFCVSAIEYASGRSAPVPSGQTGRGGAAAPVNRGGYNWGSGHALGAREHND